MRAYLIVSISTLSILLSACPSVPQNSQPIQVVSKPKKNSVYIPPENNEQWQNLGVSPNGNILNELDKKSVVRSGDVVTFRDKKTIFDKSKESRLSSLPDYKYSINNWKINCRLNTFQLTAIELYDATDKLVANFQYTDQQVKPMRIAAKSASAQQKKFVCHK